MESRTCTRSDPVTFLRLGRIVSCVMAKYVRITHVPSQMLIAEGPLGWGITPFEGNFYVRKKFLVAGSFSPSFIPGICFYKFFYIWLNFAPPHGSIARRLGWLYFLPNPLLPFIWFRVGLPGSHHDIEVEYVQPINAHQSVS